MRIASISFTALTLAALTLTGCSSPNLPSDTCVPAAQAGSLTASMTVSPNFGSTPNVALPGETSVATSQREVIVSGSGDGMVAQDGDVVGINFVVIDGDSGRELDGTEFSRDRAAAPVLVSPDYAFPGLYKGLLCAQPGERIAMAIAPQDGLGEAASADWNIQPNTTLILIMDVLTVSPPKAEGQAAQLPNGFPNVVSTEAGDVGIVLPPVAAPTEVRVAESIIGRGQKVKPEDVVIGQAISVDWATRSVLSSTWRDGTPTSFGDQANGADIRGFLTGYPIGSQVVMLLPSPTGATVHVVDILAIG